MTRRMSFRSAWRPAVVVVAFLATLCGAAAAVDAYTGSAESANARFVVASYQQLLGREPDDAGLNVHLDKVAAGGDVSREVVAEALLFGTEGSANEVDRAYRAVLGRAAEPGGLAYWTNHLGRHDVLDLRVLLMSSDEYHRIASGTNTGWIRSLYLDVLGREPEPAGMAYWKAEADRGTERAFIVAGFYLSQESLGNRTDEYYQLVLQRSATRTERTSGAALIATEGERGLYATLWASDENFEQFFDVAWSQR